MKERNNKKIREATTRGSRVEWNGSIKKAFLNIESSCDESVTWSLHHTAMSERANEIVRTRQDYYLMASLVLLLLHCAEMSNEFIICNSSAWWCCCCCCGIIQCVCTAGPRARLQRVCCEIKSSGKKGRFLYLFCHRIRRRSTLLCSVSCHVLNPTINTLPTINLTRFIYQKIIRSHRTSFQFFDLIYFFYYYYASYLQRCHCSYSILNGDSSIIGVEAFYCKGMTKCGFLPQPIAYQSECHFLLNWIDFFFGTYSRFKELL